MMASFRSCAGFGLAAVFAFNAAMPVFADGAVLDFRSPPAPEARALEPVPTAEAIPAPGARASISSASIPGLPAGPTEAALRAAVPARALRRLDPNAFAAFARSHPSGRLLTGAQLAAALAASPPEGGEGPLGTGQASRSGPEPRAAGYPLCDTLPPDMRSRCRDSLARRAPARSEGPRALRELQAKEAARRDSLARAARTPDTPSRNPGVTQDAALPDSQPAIIGEPRSAEADREDSRSLEEERTRGWFANLIYDFREGGGKDGDWDLHDWAVLIYVVIGVVVVGAFLIYGLQTLGELIWNPGEYPLFQEAGLRLSYSGHAWRDGTGADLYRDAYLAGLRYAIGFDRPGPDVGLAFEGGYIDIRLTPAGGLGDAFDFRGGYLVAGPLIRFGSFDPFCFSLEFLNGTSTHASIGWISKARMALQVRFGRHQTVGAHLGAVFYDLSFLDGLAQRRGDFNRDLSLIGGLDFGWEF